MSAPIVAVDLFCGAGGLSWGLARACEQLDRDVQLHAVNHWERAIETHERNHPWADHYHAKVEELRPREVVADGHVDVLVGGPECTHWSTARGGKPVSEQKRASPFHVLDWIEKLDVDAVLLENVPEFEDWGPVIDGEPTRNGEKFDAYVDMLHAEGYSVDWTTLDAADYGDATSRTRFFLVARREGRPTFPAPSHSDDPDDDLPDRRPAAEIIDWSDPGESIWGRDRPLVNNTMQRIAEGIRRHGADCLEPFADAIAELGEDDVEALQERIVPPRHAGTVAEILTEPFLVKYYGRPDAQQSIRRPLATIGAEPTFALCVPYVLGQQSGYVPRAVDEEPVPTIASRGSHSKIEAWPFVLPRDGYHRGIHSNPAYDAADRPLHTITAKNHDGHVVTPYLIQYNGNSGSQPLADPLPTQTATDRFALILPECWPWGLDVRFRMLKPRELAAATGFPDDYEFAGNKTETVRQIGNAVPVHLSTALCRHLLGDGGADLRDFSGEGGVPADD